MGWSREQFREESRRPRHARVSLRVACCVECGRELHATHQVSLYEARCRPCWQVFMDSVGEGLNVGR